MNGNTGSWIFWDGDKIFWPIVSKFTISFLRPCFFSFVKVSVILINPYGILQCGYKNKGALLSFFYSNIHLLSAYQVPGSLPGTIFWQTLRAWSTAPLWGKQIQGVLYKILGLPRMFQLKQSGRRRSKNFIPHKLTLFEYPCKQSRAKQKQHSLS